MDNENALEIIKWQGNLWPEWKPNDDLRALWIKQLRDYDEDVIRLVVENYKMSKKGQFKSPRMNEILELVKARQESIRSRKGEPLLVYTLECWEHPNERWVGRKYPSYIGGNQSIPELGRIKLDAQRAVEKIKTVYGGEWSYTLGKCFAEQVPF